MLSFEPVIHMHQFMIHAACLVAGSAPPGPALSKATTFVIYIIIVLNGTTITIAISLYALLETFLLNLPRLSTKFFYGCHTL